MTIAVPQMPLRDTADLVYMFPDTTSLLNDSTEPRAHPLRLVNKLSNTSNNLS
jgi:hypothetical protein